MLHLADASFAPKAATSRAPSVYRRGCSLVAHVLDGNGARVYLCMCNSGGGDGTLEGEYPQGQCIPAAPAWAAQSETGLAPDRPRPAIPLLRRQRPALHGSITNVYRCDIPSCNQGPHLNPPHPAQILAAQRAARCRISWRERLALAAICVFSRVGGGGGGGLVHMLQ